MEQSHLGSCLSTHSNNFDNSFLLVQHYLASIGLRKDLFPQARNDIRVLEVVPCFES
jgi:hypothetical protein